MADSSATAALRRRLEGALERLLRQASPALVADALAAPTDAGALARLSVEATSQDAVRQLDPLAEAVARGAAVRAELVAAAGGLLPVGEVARLLGISRQAVDKRRAKGQLLAMSIGSDWHYPAVQFGRDGVVPAGLSEVIAAMSVEGPWATLDFLLARDGALGDRTPMEALGGGDAAAVRRILAADVGDAYS